jgi:hypothetical protein
MKKGSADTHIAGSRCINDHAEHWWNDTDRRKPKYSEDTMSITKTHFMHCDKNRGAPW